jgi:molybdenum cofactor biosynthesis protein B
VSLAAHGRDAPASVRCVVVTISDTRTSETDRSGDEIAARLEAGGHQVTGRRLVRDEPEVVRDLVASLAGTVDVIVTTGGTGLTRRDSTYEAIAGLLDKRMDGFGELFRMLSFEEIGPAAMLSRACAGTARRTVVFCLPGSEPAVRLAMDRLIVPVVAHAVAMAQS